MFEKSSSYRHKRQARVKMTLAGQSPFEAWVFLKLEERLIDLLNDERAFIPVKRADGATVITAKTNIVSIVEYDDEEDTQAAPHPDAAGEAGVQREDPRAARAGPEPEPEPEPVSEAASPAPEADAPAPDGETDDTAAEDPRASKQKQRRRADDAEGDGRSEYTRRQFDPYALLRVARDASAADIRKAYKARIKAVHPDMLAALDLDEDIEKAINLTAQKVNRAYKMILKERELGKDGEPAPADSKPDATEAKPEPADAKPEPTDENVQPAEEERGAA